MAGGDRRTVRAALPALPREVLISTLQEHQRYFALENDAGELLPWFITISNIDSPIRTWCAPATSAWCGRAWRRGVLLGAGSQAAAGRARAGLDAVTFHDKLGSLGARTDRIAALAGSHRRASAPMAMRAARAAQLAKCDLLTAMVGEFPELQGIMGRYYALADGERRASLPMRFAITTCRARRRCAAGLGVGDAVALGDKLDTLAGIFASGQKPSGTRDPFGLRRAAIGVLRIVLEHRLELNLIELIDQRGALQPIAGIDAASAPASAPRSILRDGARARAVPGARGRQRHQHRDVRRGAGDAAGLAAGFRCAAARAGGFRRAPEGAEPRGRQQAHRQHPAQVGSRARRERAAAGAAVRAAARGRRARLHRACRRCARRWGARWRCTTTRGAEPARRP
jgi:hypothetical protein